MHVFVKSFISNQSTLVLESLQPTDTVKMLKTRIQEQLLIPTDHQRLIHSGIQLGEDHKTLDSYKVADGSTIHLVLRLIGGSLDGSFTGSPTNATPVLGGEFVVTNATFTSNFSTAPTTPSADLNLNNLGEMLVLPQQQETPGGAIGNEISEAVPPPTQVVEQVPASPNAHAARMAALRNALRTSFTLSKVSKNKTNHNFTLLLQNGSASNTYNGVTAPFLQELKIEFPSIADIVDKALPAADSAAEVEVDVVNTEELDPMEGVELELSRPNAKVSSIERIQPPAVFRVSVGGKTVEVTKEAYKALRKKHAAPFRGVKAMSRIAEKRKSEEEDSAVEDSVAENEDETRPHGESESGGSGGIAGDEENSREDDKVAIGIEKGQPKHFIKWISDKDTVVLDQHKGKKEGITVVSLQTRDGKKTFQVKNERAQELIGKGKLSAVKKTRSHRKKLAVV